MRSYRINMDRLVNQLVPHYLGGRKLILFLQSILQPLNSLNIGWVTWDLPGYYDGIFFKPQIW